MSARQCWGILTAFSAVGSVVSIVYTFARGKDMVNVGSGYSNGLTHVSCSQTSYRPSQYPSLVKALEARLS